MSCSRCFRPFSLAVLRSDNPDQALCRECCAHLRAGGAWDLRAETPGAAPVVCPEPLLPFRAGVLCGPVPLYPIEDDFHRAVSVAFRSTDPAAHWHLEAVRERRLRPGCALDAPTLETIDARVRARL